MKRAASHAQEVAEWELRMIAERPNEHPSRWATIQSVAQKLGMTAKLFALG